MCGPVDKIPERLTRLEHRPMKLPLFRLRLDVRCEFPSGHPNPGHSREPASETSFVLREACEFVIRIGFPVPIGGAFRVVAEFRFASPQCFLCALALRHIYSSTNKLDELAVFIENRMTRGIDVPNCSVWQKNPVLGEGVNSFAKRILKSLLYPIAILGVDLLPKIVSRRQALPWIQSENSEHFLGAVQHLFGAGIPNPTARMRQLLRFSQIRLTSL